MRLQDPNNVCIRLWLCQQTYYQYRLHPRNRQFSTLFHVERLFQQYLVDIWSTCDQTKLDWIHKNQRQIRADVYNRLTDSLVLQDGDVSTARCHVILPSSHTGNDCHMAQLFQDSMAIVQHFGRPSLFITFTANLQWKEIKAKLLPV